VILADENIVAAVVHQLREDGWGVVWIAEIAPAIGDRDVLARAVAEDRILLTDDKDFGEIVVREGRPHRGVVLLRLAEMPPAERADLVSTVFRTAMVEMKDAFTVVHADGRLRIRQPTMPPDPDEG